MSDHTRAAQRLVDEYKRSGHFDKLRTSILEKLMASEAGDVLTQRVDEIVSLSLLKTDGSLLDRKATDRLLIIIRSDLQRFPVVERAMAFLTDDLIGDESFLQSLRADLQRILSISTSPEVNGPSE